MRGSSHTVLLWLNEERHVLALEADVPLLALLARHAIRHRLRRRAWGDPLVGDEPLLEAVGALEGPLEVVLNGQLAAVGVACLRVRPGDEVVIGQPDYLRGRFRFFR